MKFYQQQFLEYLLFIKSNNNSYTRTYSCVCFRLLEVLDLPWHHIQKDRRIKFEEMIPPASLTFSEDGECHLFNSFTLFVIHSLEKIKQNNIISSWLVLFCCLYLHFIFVLLPLREMLEFWIFFKMHEIIVGCRATNFFAYIRTPLRTTVLPFKMKQNKRRKSETAA